MGAARKPSDLDGKVALITGGSVGIGLAAARELGARGARVAISSRDSARLEHAAAELKRIGIDARCVPAELADPDGARQLFERAVSLVGEPDIIVNCAALRSKVLAIDLQLEEWERVLAVNLRAPVFLSALACQIMMRKRAGKIVNVVSILESRAASARLAYTVSKAGLAAATRSLALEMAGYNVQVNAVAPGLVDTPALEPVDDVSKAELVERVTASIPVGRVADPSEVAKLIAFLSSPDANYITGQVYYIDGGMTLR